MNFTVLISVYKKENPEFFDEALESIYNQTLMPNEVLIIKDGPLSEGLDNVIDKYKRKFSEITNVLVLEKNVGLGLALKEGVLKSNNNIIIRMDSDDICMKNRFETQISFMKANPDIDAMGSWINEFDSDTGKINSIRKVKLNHKDIAIDGKIKNPMNHVTMAFKKDVVLNSVNYKDFLIFEDYYLWIRMIKSGYKLANISDCLVNVRAGDSMMGRRGGMKYFKQEFKFQLYLLNSYNLGYFKFVRNVLLRCVPRLLPKKVITLLYKISRKK
jgi:glycosyltransferase involved in cell wall biosynthesis